jgi:hypothetical protein
VSQFDDVFQALYSLKEELYRLRNIEQEYLKLKLEYEALWAQVIERKGLTVKHTRGFYFHTSPGVYTNYSAINVKEFYVAVKKVPLKSLEFHLERGDFEKWLSFICMDNLSKEVKTIRLSKLSGEALRRQLLKAIDKVR